MAGRFENIKIGLASNFDLNRYGLGVHPISDTHIKGYMLLERVAIPESQLSKWSNHGSQVGSKQTHETIREALASHAWPTGMTRDFFLQGSYRNDTNIRGDSDVDVILKFRTVYYDPSALSAKDQANLAKQFLPPKYDWKDFRRETFVALNNKFGGLVAQGNKSIKLKSDSPRLAADVVVCTEHRKYTSLDSFVEGITFWTLQDNRQIINYPKQHHDNGSEKNLRTKNLYKRTVRMFKNARNYLEDANIIGQDLAPSYFLECLLYNAPDSAFQHGFQDTYLSIAKWMNHDNISKVYCQNRQLPLFGSSREQWSHQDAKKLAKQLMALWTDWT